MISYHDVLIISLKWLGSKFAFSSASDKELSWSSELDTISHFTGSSAVTCLVEISVSSFSSSGFWLPNDVAWDESDSVASK